MKKPLIYLLAGLLIVAGCKKDEDNPTPEPEVTLEDLNVVFTNISTTEIDFEAAATVNQTVTFDVALSAVAPEAETVTLAVNASSTAVEGTHFNIASKSLSIALDGTSASGSIEVLVAGFEVGDSETIIVDLTPAKAQKGTKSQLTITVGMDAPVLVKPSCAISADYGAYSYIAQFEMGDIDNTSAVDAYDDDTDFTDTYSTTVVAGADVDFTVTVANAYGANNQDPLLLNVWVDWNGDGDFGDTDENAYSTGVVQDQGPFTGTITVPVTVTAGVYVLRVSEAYDGGSTSITAGCGTSDSGEAEDYKLVVE